MAIFSKKSDKPQNQDSGANLPAVAANPSRAVALGTGRLVLVQPRLSEKAAALAKLRQYVFRVELKANKISVRKAVEKTYGVKVSSVNMISVQGKPRRYGRSFGTTSSFKKAVVTLSPGSKHLELIETS